MRLKLFAGLAGLGICALLLGCGANSAGTGSSQSGPPNAAEEHDHDHAAAGPHGGHLIVLGEEEYHAELADDDASHSVAVYLLDGKAEKTVADSAEVVLQVLQDGQFVDHPLAASEESGKFSVADEPLCDFLLHSEEVKGRIRVTIAGKEYVGILELEAHDHSEHEGHDHDSEDADHEGHGHGAEDGDHDH